MKLSIQGTNSGTISELYTRYSFNGAKYEEGRHQICVDDGEKYGVLRGIANVELICENHMVIHIIPSDEDFETVYQGLKNPPQYLSLGRYEDLLDIERVDIVEIHMEEEADTERNLVQPGYEQPGVLQLAQTFQYGYISFLYSILGEIFVL